MSDVYSCRSTEHGQGTAVGSSENLPYLGVRYQIKYHKCNLDCPYCIASWKDRENAFDAARYYKVIENLKRLPYRICLRIGVGGEIFTSNEIMKGISDICNGANNIFGVSFSTNLVASWTRTIEPFLDSLDTGKLGMGCTLHDSVIKDVDGFFKKAEMIKRKGVALYVGYVALPGKIDIIKKYKERCDDLGIPFLMNGLIGKLSGVQEADAYLEFPRDYSPIELAELRNLWGTAHSFKMLMEGCQTKGMACSAGHQYIYINHEGTVFPCSNIKNVIGNMVDGTLMMRDEDTVCPATVCWCDNENQALRIVDRNYDRTRTLRIYTPKPGLSESELNDGYNASIFDGRNT